MGEVRREVNTFVKIKRPPEGGLNIIQRPAPPVQHEAVLES